MKKILIITFLAISLSAFSANNAETDKRVAELQGKVQALTNELATVRSNVSTLTRQVADVRVLQDSTKSHLQTTNNEVSAVKSDLSAKTTALGDSIGTTNEKVSQTSQDLNSRSLYGIIGLLGALLIAGLVYLLLRKKIKNGQTAIDSIREAQEKLNEESIKLDNQLVEIMNKQLDVQKEKTPSIGKPKEPDHSLALKVADEIVRIELNLSRMDSSIRGHNQLSRTVRRIKDNFLAQGYEISDLLGKPYTEGMKVIASFVPDDSLEPGSQIITGITKPQVIFNGKMIQAAQITVSQNI